MRFHLAQVNLSYARAPIDDPLLADFVARLDEINALADRSPGFIWRYRTDAGYPQEFSDPRVLFNMSVWESVEALHAFTYRSSHVELFAATFKQQFSPEGVKLGSGTPVHAQWRTQPAGSSPLVGCPQRTGAWTLQSPRW